MKGNKPTYKQLEARLAEAENTLKAIKGEKIDAFVGRKGVYLLRRREIEAALRQSEEKFSKAFHLSPSFMFITDLETGEFLDVNRAYCDLTGYRRDELIGRSSLELGILSGRQRAELIERLKADGRLQDLETPIVAKTGEVKPCLFSGVETLLIGDRKCLLGTGVDISERKRSEEMIVRRKEQLEKEIQNRTAEIEVQYKELEELNLLIKKLSQKTIEAMENDRQVLAKEIHDSIAGSMAAIKMQLEERLDRMRHAEKFRPSDSMSLEQIVTHLQDAIKETKRISWQLRSMTLDDFGLVPALDEHIKHFKDFYPDIEIDANFDVAQTDIPEEVQTVLYRVFQESLNNVGKHSGASRVCIELSNHNHNRIDLQVADDGNGFDLQKVLSNRDSLMGFGLHSMRERVEVCHGELSIQSEPGSGTSIGVSIPLDH